jgi:hypothetical protein
VVTGAQGALRGSYSTARTRKMPHAQGESGLSKVQIRLPEEGTFEVVRADTASNRYRSFLSSS